MAATPHSADELERSGRAVGLLNHSAVAVGAQQQQRCHSKNIPG